MHSTSNAINVAFVNSARTVLISLRSTKRKGTKKRELTGHKMNMINKKSEGMSRTI